MNKEILNAIKWCIDTVEYELGVEEPEGIPANKLREAISALEANNLPTSLDEAAEKIVINLVPTFGQKYNDGSYVGWIRDIFTREELIGLVKAGAEWMNEQIPKLPKNLDEAAKRYLQTENDLGGLYNDEGCIYESAIPDAFKAGAKWMAEQGTSFEDTVVKDEYMGYTLAETIWDKAVLVNKFNDGDKVIVQIRKK